MLSLTQYWNAMWVIDTCSVQPCPQLWNRSICTVRSAAEMLRPLKCLRWICQEENGTFTLTGLKSGDIATKAHGKHLFQTIWAGEMAQRVKVLAVKTERAGSLGPTWRKESDFCSCPDTHMSTGMHTLLLQKCNNTKKQQAKGGTCEVEAGRLL